MRKALGLLLLCALSAACSLPRVGESPGPSAPPATYVMTGEPAPPGAPPQPVLAVKVDNTPAGQPQQGVRLADLVVEEPVEGGLTRLAAFFESKSPESVGPVRSVRTSDIGLVKPVSAALIGSGGSPEALAAVQRAGVQVITEGASGFVRNPDRVAPYNLYVDLTQVRRSGVGKLSRKPYLQFGPPDMPPGQRSHQVDVTFSPSASGQWTYEPADKLWARGGDLGDFHARTLLVFEVKLVATGEKDAAHNPVPEVVTTGSGAGYLITGETAHSIRWSKDSADSHWDLSTDTGLVISVPPGRTWVSLIPKNSGDVSFS